MSTTEEYTGTAPSLDALPLDGFDYIELYVGNALQAAYFYRAAFGFTPVAYAGLETGLRDRSSYLLEQGRIRLLLTSPLVPQGEIAEHVKMHGDGVKDIAIRVPDARRVFSEAVARGARPVLEPTVTEDERGRFIQATIGVFGDTVHSFIERDGEQGFFSPAFRNMEQLPTAAGISTGLLDIDHVAISVAGGTLTKWIEFYQQVLDFHISHHEDVVTEYSAMNSQVVQNRSGLIKFPLVEPAAGLKRSQIEEHLQFYHGPGVQHLAFTTEDIIETVRALRANGNQFLTTPNTYYESLPERVGEIEEDVSALRELSVLVDRDPWGYLMQVFTKPVESRPTMFIEVIERKQARGFGGGNIKALFEANEREQARRGNL
jgi:4-hydroxyphenylpyruvate dioxygenase